MTRVLSVALFFCLAQALAAHARVTCTRVEQLGIISVDPRVQESLETYVSGLPRSNLFDVRKPFHITQFNNRFFLAGPREDSARPQVAIIGFWK